MLACEFLGLGTAARDPARAHVHEALVDRDALDPGADVGVAAEAVDVADDLDERLLKNVLGERSGREHAPRQRKDRPTECRIELRMPGAVTASGASDDLDGNGRQWCGHSGSECLDAPNGPSVASAFARPGMSQKRDTLAGSSQRPSYLSSTPWPRFGTRMVRSYEITTSPAWFSPRVLTVTIPCVGRDCDSRFASTSDSAYSVSPANTGAVSLMSFQPRLPIAL